MNKALKKLFLFLFPKLSNGKLLGEFAPTRGMTNPMTAIGDMIFGSTSGTPTRLPVGSDGQVIKVVSGTPTWSAGGGGSMVYPGAGIAKSTGSAWATSISGTSSQFVKADGTVDSSTYLTSLSGAWLLNGNTNGAKATLGSIDNYGIGFLTNNTERINIDNLGNVGFPTVDATAAVNIPWKDIATTLQLGGTISSKPATVNGRTIYSNLSHTWTGTATSTGNPKSFVTQALDSRTVNGGTTDSLVGFQSIVTRQSTFNASGGANFVLYSSQMNVSNQGSYTSGGTQGVLLNSINMGLTEAPTINKPGQIYNGTVYGQNLSITHNPTIIDGTVNDNIIGYGVSMNASASITAGTLTTKYKGFSSAGTTNAVGTQVGASYYNALVNGAGTTWNIFNDTTQPNFLGGTNSKTYFGTGANSLGSFTGSIGNSSITYNGFGLVLKGNEITAGDYIKLDANNINIPNLTASKVVFTDASKNLTNTGIGISGQFIKGDGSLDSSSYLTSVNYNYGSMLNPWNAYTVSFPGPGIWQEIIGGWSGGSQSFFTFNSWMEITGRDGWYKIDYTVSVSHGNPTDQLNSSIFVNGALANVAPDFCIIDTNGYGKFSGSTIIHLMNGDTVSVGLTNLSSPSSVDFNAGSLTIINVS